MNNLTLENMKNSSKSTLIVVVIFSILITIGVLTNKSGCRLAVHNLKASIERVASN